MDHKDIIIKLGGIRKVATAIGHPFHTTVQGWHDRNKIPVEHWADIMRVGGDCGVEIKTDDLVPEQVRDAAA